MAGKMVQKVVTGKEVGGWSEAGTRHMPNTAEARDRLQDCTVHCSNIFKRYPFANTDSEEQDSCLSQE